MRYKPLDFFDMAQASAYAPAHNKYPKITGNPMVELSAVNTGPARDQISETGWRVRVELAACERLERYAIRYIHIRHF